MTTISKTVHIGTVPRHDGTTRRMDVFCSIKYDGQRLSITGVEGPKRNGDAWGSCGQIDRTLRDSYDRDMIEYAHSWTPALLWTFLGVWDRWHLNDMRAGSPAQESYLRAHPVSVKYPESHYERASNVLASAGLNPDPDYLHNGEPYKYGHAWLDEPVSDDAIAFLVELPDSAKTPAWV